MMKTGVRWSMGFVFGLMMLTSGLIAQDTKPAAQPAGKDDKKPDLKAMQQQVLEETMKDLGIVSITKKNAHIKEIIDDLRRQSKINIVLDVRNITEKDIIPEVHLKDAPFRAALDQIMELSGLVIEEERASLIRIAKPQRVKMDFKNAPVRTVIEAIAVQGNANIIISPMVKDVAITLKVDNVPWKDVLEAVVKTANLSTVRERFNVIRIVDPVELQRQLETRVFQLEYIQPPPELKAQMQQNQYIGGKIKTTLDPVKEFTLLNILQTVMTRDSTGNKLVGKLDYDISTNSIVVTDTKPILDKVAEIIARLDREPEQVLIDVSFVSTGNEDLLTFGMSYAFGADNGLEVRARPAAGSGSETTRIPFGFGSHRVPDTHTLFLNEYDMQAIWRMFKRDRFTTIIQKPSIAVLDNSPATIFVGEDVPFAVTTAQSDQSGGTVFSIAPGQGSPVKIGFQLLVIPHVVRGTSNVLLTIIPQNEFLSGTSGAIAGFERFSIPGGGPGGSTISLDLPRISRTTAVTQMMLESGRTAIIGGLKNERSTYQDDKIPLLGDLPVIGAAFRQKNDVRTKSELLIFITPRIVKGGKITTDNLEAILKQRLKEMEKSYDDLRQREGIEEFQKRRSGEHEKEHEKMKKGE